MKLNVYGLVGFAVFAAPILCRGQGVITRVAGTPDGSASSRDGGQAASTSLTDVSAITLDGTGNLYIWENLGYRIRKVNTAGIISTVAGNGTPGLSGDGGPATSAQINICGPHCGLTTDRDGNLYLADTLNSRVRKVDKAGIITTVPGTGGCAPGGVAVDGAGNLYIGTGACPTVRKVDIAGKVTSVAGGGSSSDDGIPATSALLHQPFVVATDTVGNLYLVDESIGSRVRKVNSAGIISTIAGNGTPGFSGDGGPATSARLFEVHGLAVDKAGNVYIDDYANSRIRKVDTAGVITTVAGGGNNSEDVGIPATSAAIGNIADVAVDASGNFYIADNLHGYVFKVSVGGTSGAPAISANGVVNGASLQPGFTANSWATIFGTNLASTTDTWSSFIVNGKLPTVVDGVSVTMGGKPAYVYFISPGQINVLAPDVAPGPVSVTVTTAGGTSSTFTVTASQYGPAFFLWPGKQPVATRQDYSYPAKAGTFAGAATTPAKPGEVIILWATGLGPTVPAAPGGVAVPGGQTYSTATLPTVTINNSAATVYGAALAPGSAGLYQIAIQVPSTLADGDWPIQASIGGVQSPAGTVLTVHH